MSGSASSIKKTGIKGGGVLGVADAAPIEQGERVETGGVYELLYLQQQSIQLTQLLAFLSASLRLRRD